MLCRVSKNQVFRLPKTNPRNLLNANTIWTRLHFPPIFFFSTVTTTHTLKNHRTWKKFENMKENLVQLVFNLLHTSTRSFLKIQKPEFWVCTSPITITVFVRSRTLSTRSYRLMSDKLNCCQMFQCWCDKFWWKSSLLVLKYL